MALARVVGVPTENTIAGVLLGTALGDSLGLPHENLGPRRIARRFERGPLRQQMLWGRGLVSDDTEHASMVARALAESRGDVEAFTRSFSRQLKRWIVSLPPGVGLATLRGALRLLVGVRPEASGVYSAGNGPAMRAALLGVYAGDDEHRVQLVRASTRITHTDPRAEDGALLVARLASQLENGQTDPSIVEAIRDTDFRSRVRQAWNSAGQGLETFRTEAGYGRGVSGFVVHTVPAVVYCVLHRGEDIRGALESAIRLGGDTDTTGAIVGALLGARDGADGLPHALVSGIRDWPISTVSLRGLAKALAEGGEPPHQRWVASIPRNLAMVGLIVGHLMSRALGR